MNIFSDNTENKKTKEMIRLGVNLNKHTADTPELKSKAEEIAVLNASTINEVLRGVVEFDRYGQYFWIGEQEKAISHWNKAFEILRNARENFVEIQKREYEFMKTQTTASKVVAAQELGIMRPGSGNSVEEMFGVDYVYVQRIVQLLDHLNQMQYAGEQALAKGDLKIVYNAISTTSRHLTKTALEFYNTLVDQSQYTHEVSDVTSSILPEKVTHVKPKLREA